MAPSFRVELTDHAPRGGSGTAGERKVIGGGLVIGYLWCLWIVVYVHVL